MIFNIKIYLNYSQDNEINLRNNLFLKILKFNNDIIVNSNYVN